MPRSETTVTTPAPKYGPTPVYDECETESCTATARTTCDVCAGEYCLPHAEHESHAGRAGTD